MGLRHYSLNNFDVVGGFCNDIKTESGTVCSLNCISRTEILIELWCIETIVTVLNFFCGFSSGKCVPLLKSIYTSISAIDTHMHISTFSVHLRICVLDLLNRMQ